MTEPREVFVHLPSEARQNNEKAQTKFTRKSANWRKATRRLRSCSKRERFLALKTREHLHHCFKLIGERPVAVAARHREGFLEELRKHLTEIKSPVPRHHFIPAKFARLGEYEALLAADVTGHHGVGVLLEGAKAARVGVRRAHSASSASPRRR